MANDCRKNNGVEDPEPEGRGEVLWQGKSWPEIDGEEPRMVTDRTALPGDVGRGTRTCTTCERRR